MSSIKAIRGFKDILPEEIGWWQEVERAARRVCRLFGFREIRIPVVERTELFARSIGEDTDIVEKEMYTFPDRNNESLTLRPEATAGLVRSVIEHNLAADGRPLKLYFIGPMFRYERPQKGRQRQFHQFNVEAFNVADPHIDAEIILLLAQFLDRVGVEGVEFNINSLGCQALDCRPKFKKNLQDFLRSRQEQVCPDCRRRLEINPLRVLDCKVDRCQDAVKDAPGILDFMCGDCREHFDVVLKAIEQAGVKFTVNPRLVRGLDYYTRTTFEALAGELGAQNAVAGGGRYDGLVKALGGPDIPGLGFAVGLERLIMLLSQQKTLDMSTPALSVAAFDPTTASIGFKVVQEMRIRGVWAEMEYEHASLKSQLRRANKLGSKWVVILGPEELNNHEALLRDMTTGEQKKIPFFPEDTRATVNNIVQVTGIIGDEEDQVD